MEITWSALCLCIGLGIVELCNGLPMEILSTNEGPNAQLIGVLVAVMVSVCVVVAFVGCVCCQRRRGFKENEKKEFRDSPVAASVINESTLTGDDPGHVNPIASPEFTIFTPLSPPHHNNNVFRSHQPVISYIQNETVPEPPNKLNNTHIDGLDVSNWFDGSQNDFPRTKLKYIRELGSGWFGRVVEGEAQGITDSQSSNWTPVAVRILESTASAHEQALFLHEAAIYRLEQPHSHVLRLLGRSLEATPLLLIQEYCPKGDLKKFLLENRSCSKSPVMLGLPLQFCCQLASAIQYLHDNNLPHLDLAARTCHISSNMSLRLGDYGLAVSQYPNDYYQGTPAIPVRWCAPESLNCTNTTLQPKQVTCEGNIWSLGVTMWEISEWGTQPYSWLTDDEVVSQVMGTPHVRLPQPSLNVYYIQPLYRLMQLCWQSVELRPQISQIYSMLLHLLQTYHQDAASKSPSKSSGYAMEDFDSRWETFKPNTIVKTDNHILPDTDSTAPTEKITDVSSVSSMGEIFVNPDVQKSASLTNLHGSFENLVDGDTETPVQNMDSWLQNVASHTGDMQYVRGLSQAIQALDSALASEQTSSSTSSYEPSPAPEPADLHEDAQKIEFRLGLHSELGSATKIRMDDSNNTMDSSLFARRSESGSETEDETWKKRIERGAYSEKVRQKSKSVADLMVLTHIDCSDTDSETPLQSLEYRVSYKNVRCPPKNTLENASLMFGSEGNLLTVQDTFQEELRKLQEERRDSLLFVPAWHSLDDQTSTCISTNDCDKTLVNLSPDTKTVRLSDTDRPQLSYVHKPEETDLSASKESESVTNDNEDKNAARKESLQTLTEFNKDYYSGLNKEFESTMCDIKTKENNKTAHKEDQPTSIESSKIFYSGVNKGLEFTPSDNKDEDLEEAFIELSKNKDLKSVACGSKIEDVNEVESKKELSTSIEFRKGTYSEIDKELDEEVNEITSKAELQTFIELNKNLLAITEMLLNEERKACTEPDRSANILITDTDCYYTETNENLSAKKVDGENKNENAQNALMCVEEKLENVNSQSESFISQETPVCDVKNDCDPAKMLESDREVNLSNQEPEIKSKGKESKEIKFSDQKDEDTISEMDKSQHLFSDVISNNNVFDDFEMFISKETKNQTAELGQSDVKFEKLPEESTENVGEILHEVFKKENELLASSIKQDVLISEDNNLTEFPAEILKKKSEMKLFEENNPFIVNLDLNKELEIIEPSADVEFTNLSEPVTESTVSKTPSEKISKLEDNLSVNLEIIPYLQESVNIPDSNKTSFPQKEETVLNLEPKTENVTADFLTADDDLFFFSREKNKTFIVDTETKSKVEDIFADNYVEKEHNKTFSAEKDTFTDFFPAASSFSSAQLTDHNKTFTLEKEPYLDTKPNDESSTEDFSFPVQFDEQGKTFILKESSVVEPKLEDSFAGNLGSISQPFTDQLLLIEKEVILDEKLKDEDTLDMSAQKGINETFILKEKLHSDKTLQFEINLAPEKSQSVIETNILQLDSSEFENNVTRSTVSNSVVTKQSPTDDTFILDETKTESDPEKDVEIKNSIEEPTVIEHSLFMHSEKSTDNTFTEKKEKEVGNKNVFEESTVMDSSIQPLTSENITFTVVEESSLGKETTIKNKKEMTVMSQLSEDKTCTGEESNLEKEIHGKNAIKELPENVTFTLEKDTSLEKLTEESSIMKLDPENITFTVEKEPGLKKEMNFSQSTYIEPNILSQPSEDTLFTTQEEFVSEKNVEIVNTVNEPTLQNTTFIVQKEPAVEKIANLTSNLGKSPTNVDSNLFIVSEVPEDTTFTAEEKSHSEREMKVTSALKEPVIVSPSLQLQLCEKAFSLEQSEVKNSDTESRIAEDSSFIQSQFSENIAFNPRELCTEKETEVKKAVEEPKIVQVISLIESQPSENITFTVEKEPEKANIQNKYTVSDPNASSDHTFSLETELKSFDRNFELQSAETDTKKSESSKKEGNSEILTEILRPRENLNLLQNTFTESFMPELMVNQSNPVNSSTLVSESKLSEIYENLDIRPSSENNTTFSISASDPKLNETITKQKSLEVDESKLLEFDTHQELDEIKTLMESFQEDSLDDNSIKNSGETFNIDDKSDFLDETEQVEDEEKQKSFEIDVSDTSDFETEPKLSDDKASIENLSDVDDKSIAGTETTELYEDIIFSVKKNDFSLIQNFINNERNINAKHLDFITPPPVYEVSEASNSESEKVDDQKSASVDNKTDNKSPEITSEGDKTNKPVITPNLLDLDVLNDPSNVQQINQVYNVFNVTVDHKPPIECFTSPVKNFYNRPFDQTDIITDISGLLIESDRKKIENTTPEKLITDLSSVCTSSLPNEHLLNVLNTPPLVNGFDSDFTNKLIESLTEQDKLNARIVNDSHKIKNSESCAYVPSLVPKNLFDITDDNLSINIAADTENQSSEPQKARNDTEICQEAVTNLSNIVQSNLTSNDNKASAIIMSDLSREIKDSDMVEIVKDSQTCDGASLLERISVAAITRDFLEKLKDSEVSENVVSNVSKKTENSAIIEEASNDTLNSLLDNLSIDTSVISEYNSQNILETKITNDLVAIYKNIESSEEIINKSPSQNKPGAVVTDSVAEKCKNNIIEVDITNDNLSIHSSVFSENHSQNMSVANDLPEKLMGNETISDAPENNWNVTSSVNTVIDNWNRPEMSTEVTTDSLEKCEDDGSGQKTIRFMPKKLTDIAQDSLNILNHCDNCGQNKVTTNLGGIKENEVCKEASDLPKKVVNVSENMLRVDTLASSTSYDEDKSNITTLSGLSEEQRNSGGSKEMSGHRETEENLVHYSPVADEDGVIADNVPKTEQDSANVAEFIKVPRKLLEIAQDYLIASSVNIKNREQTVQLDSVENNFEKDTLLDLPKSGLELTAENRQEKDSAQLDLLKTNIEQTVLLGPKIENTLEECNSNKLEETVVTSTPCVKKIKKQSPNDDFFSFVSEGDEPNDFPTTVILGPCEDYALGLYSGLKTTFEKYSDDDRPEEELLQFSSNFMSFDIPPLEASDDRYFPSNKRYEAEQPSVDYSLETWDKFLGKSLQDQVNTTRSIFGHFSNEQVNLDIFNEKNKTFDINPNETYDMKGTDLNKTVDVTKNNNRTFLVDENPQQNNTYNCEPTAESAENDATFVLDKENQKDAYGENDSEPVISSSWEPGEGWFLHPQIPPEDMSGHIDISANENVDNSYVGFALDEECVNALRNELVAKLPHAQGISHEEQEPDDWDSEERNEVIVKYNVYATPLSPIPEESCCDDVYCDRSQHRDGSDSDSEWSEPCMGRTSQLEDILVVDTETHTALILESPSLREPQHRHTPSQDSCCSNDTLFNLEDLNYGPVSNEHSPHHQPTSTQSTDLDQDQQEDLILQIEFSESDETPRELSSKEDDDVETTPKITEVTETSESLDANLTYTKPDINIDASESNKDKPSSLTENVVDSSTPSSETVEEKEEEKTSESKSLNKLELKLEPGAFGVAPLPSPEDIPWRQLPASLLTYNEVVQNDKFDMQDSDIAQDTEMANVIDSEELNLVQDNPKLEDDLSDSVRECTLDTDLYSNLTDIRFSGPCDTQLMSTSFSESVDYAEERDWDSGSDTRSSSSGEFIWREGEHEESLRALHAASQDVGVTEDLNPMDTIQEENSNSSNDDSDDDGEDIEETEFVPSAWDSQATPTKSALKSPEKSNKRKNQQKGVWFKKQKYHCVYEYPREPESPVAATPDLWRPVSDFSNFTDWELDPESCVLPFDDQSTSDCRDGYEDVLDKYISRSSYPLASGSTRHRDLYQLNPFHDFTTGMPGSDEDFFISSSARPFQSLGQGSQFFPGQNTSKSKSLWQDYQPSSAQSSKDFSENITPDSGVEDVTPASIPDNVGIAQSLILSSPPKNSVQSLKCLAALAANKTAASEHKGSLGGLRHTRSRLKLDLPPSPNSFTSNRTFTIDVPSDPVVNREVPTFTTFGKSRFSVQHVQTPTDEPDSVCTLDKPPKARNVSFEALPHKPMKSGHSSVYILDNADDNGKHKPVEMVQGEASLLDSADEDSGIESSANATLERRQQQILH